MATKVIWKVFMCIFVVENVICDNVWSSWCRLEGWKYHMLLTLNNNVWGREIGQHSLLRLYTLLHMNKMCQLMHPSLLKLANIPQHMFRHYKSPSPGGRLEWSSLNHPLGSGAEHSNSAVCSLTARSTDSIHSTYIYLSHRRARLKFCKITSCAHDVILQYFSLAW
jgi:hypothetical protein